MSRARRLALGIALAPVVAALMALAAPAMRLEEPSAVPVPTPRPAPPVHAADAGAAPTLDEMIGAMLMVGFDGDDVEDPGPRALAAHIRDGRVGGVIFFRRNVTSEAAVRRMTHAFAAAAPGLPVLIAIDQEGGRVERLTDRVGFRETASAAWVGNRSLRQAAGTYRRLAEALADWGFNTNLGPVLDLAANPKNRVIYGQGRAYSADPERVEAFARTFVDAHREAGLLTALKHFPGHGSSSGDTHHGFVDVSATWTPTELAPFEELIDEGRADMVMVAHVHESDLAGEEDTPASLSAQVIEGLLRGELGYRGVVISDDLEMGAIAELGTPVEIALRALLAGNDILVYAGGSAEDGDLVAAIHDHLLAAAEDPFVAARIRESYHRIVRLRTELAARRTAAAPPAATASAQ